MKTISILLVVACAILAQYSIIELRKCIDEYTMYAEESKKGFDRYQALKECRIEIFKTTTFCVFFILVAVIAFWYGH